MGMSCQRCYSRKIKCDRKSPSCSNCQKAGILCKSAINTRNTPFLRKRNRIEREEIGLKKKIELYERYMKRIGIDPQLAFSPAQQQQADLIISGSSETCSPTSFTLSEKQCDRISEQQNRQSKGSELQQIFFILRGDFEGANLILSSSSAENCDNDKSNNLEQIKAYNQGFTFNASEWFQNQIDKDQPRLHPDPFKMFQLFSIYIETIHHFRPIIKRDRLQEIFFSFGPAAQDPIKVNIIEPSYNALLFSIYCASISSINSKTFSEIFPTLEAANERTQLFESYYNNARYWLIRSDFLQSNDLLVFEAFIILFRAIQPSMQPRSFISFISLVKRSIERIGMEQFYLDESDSAQLNRWLRISLELGEIESITLNRAAWTGPYPINTNSLQSNLFAIRQNPVDNQNCMLLNLIRYEVFIFRIKIRENHGHLVDWTDFSSTTVSLNVKLKEIQNFFDYVMKEYFQESRICEGEHCLPSVRTISMLFLSLELLEMKISAYACEERLIILRKEEVIGYTKIRQELLKFCMEAIDTFQKAYQDPNLHIVITRNVIKKPAFAILHLLRICSAKRFKSFDNLDEDDLIMKAWKCLDDYHLARKSIETNFANLSTPHDTALLASWNSWSDHYKKGKFNKTNLVEWEIISDFKQREIQKNNITLQNRDPELIRIDSNNDQEMIEMFFNLSEPIAFDWNSFE